MKENALVDLSKQFAVDIVNICTEITDLSKSRHLWMGAGFDVYRISDGLWEF